MSTGDQTPQLVYWPVGLGSRSFTDHLDVAQSGGFSALALTPKRAKGLIDSGLTVQNIKDLAAERGLKIGPADGIATWVRDWRSTRGDRTLRDMMIDVFDIDLREALEISAALGMSTAVGVAFFDEGSIPEAEIVASLGRFCDLAKPYDIEIALEPIPFWGIPDLPLAWKIIQAIGRPNLSILIDTWHIEKGSRNFARDLGLLEAIPGARLRHVQLADADRAPRADTLAGDVLFRKFPGEGELQLARMLAIIMKKGGLVSVGPEIVNAEQGTMDNRSIGERSGSSTRQLIDQARELASSLL